MQEKELSLIKKWKATIRLAHGLLQVVFVQADTAQKAALMLELQFGRGCIARQPVAAALTMRPDTHDRGGGLTARLLSQCDKLQNS